MKNKFVILVQICVFLSLASCHGTTTGPQVSTGPAPPAFFIKQNYPNPFTDTTSIEYGVPATGGRNSVVTVIVYDLFRKEMRILVNNISHPPGTFQTQWDGFDSKGITVPSGLYIIEMQGYTPQTTILFITAIKE